MLKNSRKTSRKSVYFGKKFVLQRKFCLEIQSIRHILDSYIASLLLKDIFFNLIRINVSLFKENESFLLFARSIRYLPSNYLILSSHWEGETTHE